MTPNPLRCHSTEDVYRHGDTALAMRSALPTELRHARTRLLPVALGLLLVTAGCVGAGPAASPTPTDTHPSSSDSPTPTDTPPSSSASPTDPADSATTSPRGSPTTETPIRAPKTPLPNRTVELPDGPKTAPERPDELTTATVREYARQFEYRYVYNSLWYNQYSEVSAECEVLWSTETDIGWKVVVSCTAYSNTGGPTEGTASPTVLHADWFTQVYTYLIDEDSTVRRDATDEEEARGRQSVGI
jgi:hypothetical protein